MFFLILIFSFGNFRISDGLSPSLLQLNFSTPLYAEALPPIRIANDIPSLDWHKTLDLISARVILNLMVGLTEFNKEGKLVRPTVSLPSLLSFTVSLPIRLDLVEAYGDKWLAPSKLAVLGPYKLAESKSQQIVLEVNDQYFGPPPRIKKFKFTTVNEGQTTLDLFYIV